MYKGSQLIGKPIVSYAAGEKLETVQDIVFDSTDNQVLAVLVDEGGLFSTARVVPFSSIKSIGSDALMIKSEADIVEASTDPKIQRIIEAYKPIKGMSVMTESGKDLGQVIDIYFDEQTGQIEGYEVSGGAMADLYTGRPFLPVPETLKVGDDVVFVPDSAANTLREQVGGLKAAGQQAANRASGKAEELRQGWQKSQPTAQSELESFWQSVKESASRLTGQASEAVEEQRIKGALGRPVTRVIFDRSDQVILNTGDLITNEAIDRARQAGVLDVLLNSVYTDKPRLSKEDMRIKRQ